MRAPWWGEERCGRRSFEVRPVEVEPFLTREAPAAGGEDEGGATRGAARGSREAAERQPRGSRRGRGRCSFPEPCRSRPAGAAGDARREARGGVREPRSGRAGRVRDERRDVREEMSERERCLAERHSLRGRPRPHLGVSRPGSPQVRPQAGEEARLGPRSQPRLAAARPLSARPRRGRRPAAHALLRLDVRAPGKEAARRRRDAALRHRGRGRRRRRHPAARRVLSEAQAVRLCATGGSGTEGSILWYCFPIALTVQTRNRDAVYKHITPHRAAHNAKALGIYRHPLGI